MRKNMMRVISCILTAAMVICTMPVQAIAYVADTGGQVTLHDSSGNSIVTDESWKEKFPYGTFAFAESELKCREDGGEQTVKIHRLGGTAGKADVTVSVTPVLTQLDDGSYSAAMAAGCYDYVLSVEDPLPIAEYQEYGQDAQPLAAAEPATVIADGSDAADDAAASDDEGAVTLKLSVAADAYEWQGLNSKGAWESVGTDATLEMTAEAAEKTDFRCVYTVNGSRYCSTSYKGEAYVPENNEAKTVPDGVELDPEKTFSVIDFEKDGVDEYDSYEFTVTFAEGESVKEIKIAPVNDSEHENTELLAVRLASCKGGELYDTANTLTVAIEDDEEQLPSYFAYADNSIYADKSEGKAVLTVRRTGALQYVTTVDYRTEDASAKAGTDYEETSGTLYFPADVSEMKIEIPLINDGDKVSMKDSDLSFKVLLDNPQGGGEDTAVTDGEAEVILYNTGKDDGANLATMLYTPEADDVSGNTDITENSIVKKSDKLTAEPEKQPEVANIDFSFGASDSDGEISLQEHDMSASLETTRKKLSEKLGRNYTSVYWDNYADFGGCSGESEVNNTQGLAYTGWDNTSQVSKQSDGYMGRRVNDVGNGNTKRARYNYQVISDFDQLFTKVTAVYRGFTDKNWSKSFWTTVWVGIWEKDNYGGQYISGRSNRFSNEERTFDIENGDKGLYFAVGIADKSWSDTGSPDAAVYQKSKGKRRTVENVKYLIHTADDEAIESTARTKLYEYIAPSVGIVSGQGGITADKSKGKYYVGTQFSLSAPKWNTYKYIDEEAGNYPLYISNSAKTKVSIGTTAKNGTGNVRLIGSNNGTFAAGGSGRYREDDTYTINAVLNREQKISVNIAPSVPRLEDGKTIDSNKISDTIENFWKRANITVQGAKAKGTSFVSDVYTLPDGALNADKDDATVIKSSGTYDNIKYINFNLPHADQILFNGVQYSGDQNIPIPVSMYGMETLPFTYYASDYISVEGDMSLAITRVEQYVDMNGNGKIDGYLDNVNQFHAENGDYLVAVISGEDYSIGNFTPVLNKNGKPVQQFFKFYYSLTPKCLTVPAGGKEDDPAQILPSFVTSITDEGKKSQLSDEMQGYRFITSGKYTADQNVRDNNGKIVITHKSGDYSGDGKLMYKAAANAIETVDIPLGGNYSSPVPTYLYSNSVTDETETTKEKPSVWLTDERIGEGWSVKDAYFYREDWKPEYNGNLLYQFHDPSAAFISDSLYGEVLPVASEDKKSSSGYSVKDTNDYLGSFNPLDTVSLCVRAQGSMDTDSIHDMYDVKSESLLSAIKDKLFAQDTEVVSGEYSVNVDSANGAGFKTIPDAESLRVTTGTDDGSNQKADSSASSNSMKEFNMDMGIELPSMSLGITDHITLIMDGDEVGFSVGVPIFNAGASKGVKDGDNGKSEQATTWSDWETGNTKSEVSDEVGKAKEFFSSPLSALQSDEWKAAKKLADQNSAQRLKNKQLDDKNLKEPASSVVKSSGMEFSIAANVTVMFKYSHLDNSFHFSSAMVFMQFGFEFRKEVRLSVCPIVYIYVVVGGSLEAAGGVVNEREVVESDNIVNFTNGQSGKWTLEADDTAKKHDMLKGEPGAELEFTSTSDAFNLYFRGTVKIEKKASGDQEYSNLGYVSSDGSEPTLVMLDNKVDQPNGYGCSIRLTVLDETAWLDAAVPINKIRNDTFFSGLSMTPAAFMEVGGGIGVEVLKVEVYFKASVQITFSFATRQNNAATKGNQLRDPSTSSLSIGDMSYSLASDGGSVSAYSSDVQPFSFDSFQMRAGLGVRVVLLLFSFEMDMIQFGIDYENGEGWKFAWYAFNQSKELASYSLDDVDDSDGFPGIKITLPANTYTAQQIFGPEEGSMIMDEISTMAYDPVSLAGKEFQISGYSSQGDAFRLADDLSAGTDYKLLTVGDENYMLYSISREAPENSVDSNMLVLSRLKNTGKQTGLVHPVTGESENGKNYLIVDNDNTGDLDFTATVDGNTIHAAWVSYASATGAAGGSGQGGSVSKPSSDKAIPSYKDGSEDIFMNADNYDDRRFKPTPPDTVTECTKPSGREITEAPLRSDYVLDDPDESISTDGYIKVENENSYYKEAYSSYTEAEKAYQDANKAFIAWESWRAWEKYTLEDSEYIAYRAWYDYFAHGEEAASNAKDQLAQSSHNTVVKTADFTVGSSSAFTTPVTAADSSDGAYKFLPSVSTDGRLTFYARTVNYSDDEKKAADEKAKAYYDASKGSYRTDSSGINKGTGDPTAAFRYTYETSMNDVYGKTTQFLFTVADADGKLVTTGFTPENWEKSGVRLSSVDLVMTGSDTFYLAYTATQNETQVSGSDYADRSVHKLYLQKGSIGSDGKVTLDTAKMLRALVDVNDNSDGTLGFSSLTSGSGSSPDGIYANTGSGLKLVKECRDPYFGTVQFLAGKLGSLQGDEEDFGESLGFTKLFGGNDESSLFLLFEMNGSAYIVPEDSLNSITGGGKGSIISFFESEDGSTGAGNLAIGADGDGNISAVYTKAVAGTTNNAVYVSKYDPDTATFGEGRMLAMNGMQVYEDSVSNEWGSEETEAAYYDVAKGGGMKTFSFNSLAVALGIKKDISVINPDEAAADPAAAETADNSTLVVIARGTETQLKEENYLGGGGNKLITADTSKTPSTGYYALSFGVSEKSIGEGSIFFTENDFTTGARLRPVVSFTNTGDVPIRASKSAPVSVGLWISGQPTGEGDSKSYPAGEKLFSWTLTENIGVGQNVVTSLENDDAAAPLPENLGGRKFYFRVSEDKKYAEESGGSAFEYSSIAAPGGFTVEVESKSELAVEDMTFTTAGVEGDRVKIHADMKVTNRGAAASAAPYIQFAYQTGRTMEEVKDGDTDYQQDIYAPLNISDGSFTVSRQTPVAVMAANGDASKGILRLVGPDGADLQAGNERRVTGDFYVSKDAYCQATATGSLNIKVTVFDSNTPVTTLSADGLIASTFDNEYNRANNTEFVSMEPVTLFENAPNKITVPLGTTMRLSLKALTTERSNPVITADELNCQAQETAEKNLGILYYNMGTSGTGSDGYLVISPSSEGSGIIRVADLNTNSWTDISYTVTSAGSGVNIFKDNNRFTWYDSAGKQLDPDTDDSNAWIFQSGVTEWGRGKEPGVPYLGDVSRTDHRNTSFKFTTLAETIDLYFDGTVQVTSSADGYRTQELTASGGNGSDSSAVIDLGKNPNNIARTVTVKVISDDAFFDRMVEHYSGNQIILPDTEGDGPQIYFSRVMPETASLDPAVYKDGFRITVYVVDDDGLGQLNVDPGTSGASAADLIKHNDCFSEFSVVVKNNGTFTVNASDTSGNTSSSTVNADWFNTAVSQPDDPLIMNPVWKYRDANGDIEGIGDDTLLRAGQNAYLEPGVNWGASLTGDEKTTLQLYNVTQINEKTTYTLEKRTEGTGAGEGGSGESNETIKYVLVKTVTRTDAAGAQIGEPEVTETEASADTNVPADTSVQKTRGTWTDITPVEMMKDADGNDTEAASFYHVNANGIYKLTASQDGRRSVKLFLMNRINNDLPSLSLSYSSVSDSYDAPVINYTAEKGKASASGLTAVYLNGVKLRDLSNEEKASGTIEARFGGKYAVSVDDAAGNRQEAAYDAVQKLEIPEAAVNVISADNNDSDNGSVTVDTSKVLGGTLDSVNESGPVNSYMFALVPESDNFKEAAEGGQPDTDFDSFADSLNWKTCTDNESLVYNDLKSGVYYLYMKDTNDTPIDKKSTKDDYAVINLGVSDHTIDFLAYGRSGKLDITASGGSGVYEFLAFERSYIQDAVTDMSKIEELVESNGGLSWMGSEDEHYVYEGMLSGRYQVVVRDRYAPENYKIKLVTVKRSSGSLTDDNKEAVKGSASEENKDNSIIAGRDDVKVIIPKGTLPSDADVSRMILSEEDAGKLANDGTVIRCTTPDGKVSIIPWCVYENGVITYIADRYGDYDVTDNAKKFSDTEGHWAEKYIADAAAREIFNGTGNQMFSPANTMTRGMLVTVLGRMANADAGTNKESSFSDVERGSWYAPYVDWASENGIVTGYGDGAFGPKDLVTREQMAVMLRRYAEYMGYKGSEKGDLSKFNDSGAVSSWAEEACEWATGCGILNGKDDGLLDPKGNATRAEASAMMMRFIEYSVKNAEASAKRIEL